MRPSRLLAGEDGLFVTRNVEEGEWIASFGPMRRVTAEDTGKIPYSIPIRETGSRTLVYFTPIGRVQDQYRAHAMNHTCGAADSNAVITHTGDIARKAQVLVRATRDIAKGREVFACYGPKDKIRFFDQCGCRCHQCADLDGRASLSDMEDEAICGGGIRNSTRANARRFATSTQLDDIDAEEATRGQ